MFEAKLAKLNEERKITKARMEAEDKESAEISNFLSQRVRKFKDERVKNKIEDLIVSSSSMFSSGLSGTEASAPKITKVSNASSGGRGSDPGSIPEEEKDENSDGQSSS